MRTEEGRTRGGKRLGKLRHQPGEWIFFFYNNQPRREMLYRVQITIDKKRKQSVVYFILIPEVVSNLDTDLLEEEIEDRHLLQLPQVECYSTLELLLAEMKQRFELSQEGIGEQDINELI